MISACAALVTSKVARNSSSGVKPYYPQFIVAVAVIPLFPQAKDELSGADIKAVCTESGLLALRERRMRVTQDDFRKAKEKALYRKKGTERECSDRMGWCSTPHCIALARLCALPYLLVPYYFLLQLLSRLCALYSLVSPMCVVCFCTCAAQGMYL